MAGRSRPSLSYSAFSANKCLSKPLPADYNLVTIIHNKSLTGVQRDVLSTHQDYGAHAISYRHTQHAGYTAAEKTAAFVKCH